MNNPIRISVVVPFYNSQRYIEECIHALLAQTYPSNQYEVIMVDNNSTDASPAIAAQYPRLNLRSEPRPGAYVARNCGMAASSGDVIAFTDPDCVPARDWLEHVDRAMRQTGTQIVLGTHKFGVNSPALRLLEDYEGEKKDYVFNSTIKNVYYGYANNMAVRRTLFGELGPFVEIPRGSDVVLVRKCVDRYSCDAVRYSRTIKVRHLEIDSARKYFEKAFTYGKSIHCYGPIGKARPISTWERSQIFRNTVQKNDYGWKRSTLLFGLLVVGLLYWIFGGISAALMPTDRAR
ncbi:MAG TPA: glycosyltransferase family 2 protein [Chthoniobacterales bacterium]|jgi:glycosyltransferase involved in cell wall biosynthesis